MQARNLNRKNFHLFQKMVKELQRSASYFSISMTEFSLPLKRVMEGDVPVGLLRCICLPIRITRSMAVEGAN